MFERNEEREQAAKIAAHAACQDLGIKPHEARIGIILGTGWGDVLKLSHSSEVWLNGLPGFEGVRPIPNHARSFMSGELAGTRVLVMRGRIHLYESPYPEHIERVRLQTELLLQLGVTHLILTASVGSLKDEVIKVGDIAIMYGFLSLFFEQKPGFGAEHGIPDRHLDDTLAASAYGAGRTVGLTMHRARHAYIRGPFFEGPTDKSALRMLGGDVVGMSIQPETCVASVYEGTRVLGLGFVSNTAFERHDATVIAERAKASAGKLGTLITEIVQGIRL